ncbi:MAG: hypothetical protein CVU39_05555 [Chloroflexi bacterium HGW-Chloroflexi-10]|nr:MAG: hypothetical protein CVU39_05555 [Chloroflexi bacterium HGW-Chloroflexi-10]
MIQNNSITNKLSASVRSWLLNNRLSLTTTLLLIGLLAFEMFNYSTTDYALKDLLGELKFAGLFWSTILAVAFCGIDFAGITRLFIPDDQALDQKENWFLFGAWLLAATMNATLTWWGVSMSLVNHSIQSAAIIDQQTINQVVPIFVALMVWVTRILLIGSLTFSTQKRVNHQPGYSNQNNQNRSSNQTISRPSSRTIQPVGAQMKPTTNNHFSNNNYSRPEPEYVNDNVVSTIPQPAFKENARGNNPRRF